MFKNHQINYETDLSIEECFTILSSKSYIKLTHNKNGIVFKRTENSFSYFYHIAYVTPNSNLVKGLFYILPNGKTKVEAYVTVSLKWQLIVILALNFIICLLNYDSKNILELFYGFLLGNLIFSLLICLMGVLNLHSPLIYNNKDLISFLTKLIPKSTV
ncbi:MAG: hypothetical protein U0V72_03320 [Cytophagales bacterium]